MNNPHTRRSGRMENTVNANNGKAKLKAGTHRRPLNFIFWKTALRCAKLHLYLWM